MPHKLKTIYRSSPDTVLAEKINSMLDDAFGTPYLTPADVHHYMLDPESTVITVMDGKTIAGVGLAIHIPHTEPLDYSVPEDQIENLLALVPELATDPAIYLHSVVINPDYQKRGIGTRLVQEILQWSSLQEPNLIYVQGWKDHNGCHIENIMNAFGFSKRGVLENCHLEESLADPDSQCSSCGNPCYCSEVIFTKETPRVPLSGVLPIVPIP